MKLQDWLSAWPYGGRNYVDGAGFGPFNEAPNGVALYAVADCGATGRDEAWHLEDYRVSAVSGGSLWFYPKSDTTCAPSE